MLNSKIVPSVISSEARNLLDSSTYAIIFYPLFVVINILMLSADSRDFSLCSK